MRAASKTTKTVLDARLRRRIIALKRSAITSIYETQPISSPAVFRRGAGNWLVFGPGRSGWAGSGERGAMVRRSSALTLYAPLPAHAPRSHALADAGTLTLDGQTVRFIRPGLTEEYSVGLDGVRQDFIIEQRPVGAGPLRVELVVTGAKVEPLADGAQLVLENAGRKIAYSRMRVTEATGKELTAREELEAGSPASDHESDVAA